VFHQHTKNGHEGHIGTLMKQFKEYLTTSLFTSHKPATEHISHGFSPSLG